MRHCEERSEPGSAAGGKDLSFGKCGTENGKCAISKGEGLRSYVKVRLLQ